MNQSSANTLFLRRPAPPREARTLRAGPLTALFDPTTGFLRQIRLGQREVLRGIYAAVRDQNWNTVPPTITSCKIEEQPGSFSILLQCAHRREEIAFEWAGSIVGGEDGQIDYTFDGEAKSTFLKNRIGFCVLHPIRECAGARATQTRADGSQLEGQFPLRIEPQIVGQSPFRDLKALAHEVGPGQWAEVAFEGDLFEMEDQRNWSDASFKTYCTPLSLPFPAEIKAGTQIRQKVSFRLRGEAGAVPPAPLAPESPLHKMERTWRGIVDLDWDATRRSWTPMPKLGFALPAEGLDPNAGSLDKLRRLKPAHLRVDLRLEEQDWKMGLDHGLDAAAQIGCALEVALRAGRNPMVLWEVGALLRDSPAPIARVILFTERGLPATAELMAQAVAALEGVEAAVGTGSDANFCELNRERALGTLPAAGVDFLAWSMNPQVHAVDSMSVMETLESIGEMVGTAKSWGLGRCVVSPVTLRQRFNPVATSAEARPDPRELPPDVDARQLSLFGAAWTVGCLAELAAAGVESATLFETTGWRGVMEDASGSNMPGLFASEAGAVFPLYHAFAACVGFSQRGSLAGDSRREIAGLALGGADGARRLLLANLSNAPRVVGLPPAAGGGMWRRLEAANEPDFRRRPERMLTQPASKLLSGRPVVVLEPHALGVLDLV